VQQQLQLAAGTDGFWLEFYLTYQPLEDSDLDFLCEGRVSNIYIGKQ
jgi:hypothetical protein